MKKEEAEAVKKIGVEKSLLDEISNLAARRGFFFPSCEVYSDANAGFYDYGPFGVLLKNKIIEQWREQLVKKDGMLEIDGCQIMSKSVFEASGHLTSFSDPLVQCEKCKFISRADKLIEEKAKKSVPEKLEPKEYDNLIEKHKIKCPKCDSKLGKTRRWNMMFGLGIGAEGKEGYLRPETCQSIFVDWPRLAATMRIKLPVGICQIGKAFRNEISPRQSLLRTREFTQAEIEVFFNPKKTQIKEKFKEIENYSLQLLPEKKKEIMAVKAKEAVSKKIISNELLAYYLSLLQRFYENIGFRKENMRFRELGNEERAFYAKEAWDFEVLTSSGWVELVACNNRGDYDLGGHAKKSCKNFEFMDENEKVLPWIFELSMGIDRTLYCLMDKAFKKEKVEKTGEERILMQFPAKIAPIQIAIFPLVNKDRLPEIALSIYNQLEDKFEALYDNAGSIGKMYRRQDEIGTPFCITVDYQSKEDKTVTLRNRDDMSQKRIKISDLDKELGKLLM